MNKITIKGVKKVVFGTGYGFYGEDGKDITPPELEDPEELDIETVRLYDVWEVNIDQSIAINETEYIFKEITVCTYDKEGKELVCRPERKFWIE